MDIQALTLKYTQLSETLRWQRPDVRITADESTLSHCSGSEGTALDDFDDVQNGQNKLYKLHCLHVLEQLASLPKKIMSNINIRHFRTT